MASHLSRKLVIGIAGHARCGKNTVANFIKDTINKNCEDAAVHEFTFAEPIKKANLAMLEPLLDSSVNPMADLERAKNNGQKIHGIDIRYALQHLGTVYRKQNQDIFAEIMVHRIKNELNKSAGYFEQYFSAPEDLQIFIIPDTRFVNEETLLREAFGDDYILLKVDKPEITVKALNGVSPYDHESEQQIRFLTPDHTFKNDGALENLEKKVETYMLKLLKFRGLSS